jgi:hypothetical protein
MAEYTIKKATVVNGWVRAMFYGPYKSGKTLLALSAPKPLLIDIEGGARVYAAKYDFDVIEARSYARVKKVLEDIRDGVIKGYGTVILDSMTRILNNTRDVQMEALKAKATKYGKTYDESLGLGMQGNAAVNRKMKTLSEIIEQLPINAIVIAHQSDILEEDGKGGFKKIGVRPDIDKTAGYAYDYIIRFAADGKTFTTTVEGARTLDATMIGKTFKNATWDTIFGKVKVDDKAETKPAQTDEEAQKEDLKVETDAMDSGDVNKRKLAIKNRVVTEYMLTEAEFNQAAAATKAKKFSFEDDEKVFEEQLAAEANAIVKARDTEKV